MVRDPKESFRISERDNTEREDKYFINDSVDLEVRYRKRGYKSFNLGNIDCKFCFGTGSTRSIHEYDFEQGVVDGAHGLDNTVDHSKCLYCGGTGHKSILKKTMKSVQRRLGLERNYDWPYCYDSPLEGEQAHKKFRNSECPEL